MRAPCVSSRMRKVTKGRSGQVSSARRNLSTSTRYWARAARWVARASALGGWAGAVAFTGPGGALGADVDVSIGAVAVFVGGADAVGEIAADGFSAGSAAGALVKGRLDGDRAFVGGGEGGDRRQ